MPTIHKVVILGTGFGGIYALKSIARQTRGKAVHITIIGRNNYFLFTPMLHEVATGVISHHQAAVAVRELLPHKSTQYMMAEITAIDREKKKVLTSVGDVSYDTLVIATGATTNFFGVKGAEKYAMPFKTMMDAIRFRHRMTEQFEKAVMEMDAAKRRELMTVVVIGGGPTGVEFSAEAAEMIFDTFLKSSQGRLSKKDLRVCLLHRGTSIIDMFRPSLQKEAMQSLKHDGVEIHLEDEVVEIKKDRVITKSGKEYPSTMVMWMAGVKPSIPEFMGRQPAMEMGRLLVKPTLQLEDDPAIFALGDASYWKDVNGKPLPMLAQVASQEGKYLGKALRALLEKHDPAPYTPHLLGELVSLGPWSAIGQVMGIGIKGGLASIFWKSVYLFKFLSFPKRLKILLDWALGLFTRRDITIS